ncbi:von Willebrand factor type A domain-containing protein [Agromyces sp. CF514]|uniref:VWA domain-containing protein n=1 Tax=Agromyces sp. CF514 TaxID=1881031 RepID=UPI0008E6B8FD|nr:VWA domain-containing protein [Agromyces sp. CF514]SFR74222.1 von Willebrand factor type A domain-containing protein [Agromyces sp. CF514]
MGRHSVTAPTKTSRRGLYLSVIAAVVVVGVVASGVYLWIGGHFDPDQAAAGSECESAEQLHIVADTTIASVLTVIASDFDAANEGCVTTEITAQESADTSAVLASGGLDADAWVPQSAVWVDRAAATAASLGRATPNAYVGDTLAASPVVFATTASDAAEVAAEPLTWTRVLDGTLPAILPDPEASAASLSSLVGLGAHAPAEDPRPLAAAMIALSKSIPASTSAAFGALSSAETPSVVLTSEAQVAEYNSDGPTETLTAGYPTDGTLMLDYPLVLVGDAADEAVAADEAQQATEAPADAPATETPAPEAAGDASGAVRTASYTTEGTDDLPATAEPSARARMLAAFEQAAASATERLNAAGFRTADGVGEIDTLGIAPEGPAAQVVPVDSATALTLLRTWGVLSLRARYLAVVDVSGSMEEPAANGLRRIDIFQQAAMNAVSKFSGEVDLGVWAFSTMRNGDLDYEELAPIAPLGDAAHTQQIAGIIQSLPSRLGGATGLYDTVLASVNRVREGYDPEKVNAVLLITDGKNEDENGIDLDTLLAELQKADDGTKPVPVIMIGFGPDTDLAAMQKIAEVTKGGAYSASKPEDLGIVLVDAISQRSCRPNCG